MRAFVDLHGFNTKGVLFISDNVYHKFKEAVSLACLEIVSGKDVECYQLPFKHLPWLGEGGSEGGERERFRKFSFF